MAVYKHSYQAYTGELTSLPVRVWVMVRYGLDEVWSSKITIGLFILCLLPCLVSLVGIYLANNPIARLLVGNNGPRNLQIGPTFFLTVLQVQSWLALVLASWIAPRLISFDLADNALPILLSHPISRFWYISSKLIALFTSLSVVTWVPCLLLFAYQGYSSPQPWVSSHLGLGAGLLAGAVIWIAFLSMLSLAVSSWVKWRVVATGIVFATILVPAGIGAIVSAVLRTRWGFLFNVPLMMSELWQRLLGAPEQIKGGLSLPTAAIVTMLLLVCLLCVGMLHTRIRAREVVRG